MVLDDTRLSRPAFLFLPLTLLPPHSLGLTWGSPLPPGLKGWNQVLQMPQSRGEAFLRQWVLVTGWMRGLQGRRETDTLPAQLPQGRLSSLLGAKGAGRFFRAERTPAVSTGPGFQGAGGAGVAEAEGRDGRAGMQSSGGVTGPFVPGSVLACFLSEVLSAPKALQQYE